MAVVRVRINGKDYDVACDDGQEEHLRLLADDVDERVRALIFGAGSNPGESMALILTALTMADELYENKRKNEQNRSDILNLTNAQAVAPGLVPESRVFDLENAMASTLDEIAVRIERIADQIEIR